MLFSSAAVCRKKNVSIMPSQSTVYTKSTLWAGLTYSVGLRNWEPENNRSLSTWQDELSWRPVVGRQDLQPQVALASQLLIKGMKLLKLSKVWESNYYVTYVLKFTKSLDQCNLPFLHKEMNTINMFRFYNTAKEGNAINIIKSAIMSFLSAQGFWLLPLQNDFPVWSLC